MKNFIIILALICAVNIHQQVQATVYTGSDCGATEDDVCEWSFDDSTGVLTISGSGKMAGYGAEYGIAGTAHTNAMEARPWQAYVNSITSVIVNNGITGIGARAFEYFGNVKTITIADSVTTVGSYAIAHNKNVETITLSSSLETLTTFGNSTKLINVYCSILKQDLCEQILQQSSNNTPNANLILYQKNTDGSTKYYDKDGNLKTIRGKKIYTVEEAEAVTAHGDKFHVSLTYK